MQHGYSSLLIFEKELQDCNKGMKWKMEKRQAERSEAVSPSEARLTFEMTFK